MSSAGRNDDQGRLRLPGAPATDPDVQYSRIRFLGRTRSSSERHVSRKHQFVLQAARLGDAGFGDTKLFDGTTEGRPCETLTLTPAPVQPLERIGKGARLN